MAEKAARRTDRNGSGGTRTGRRAQGAGPDPGARRPQVEGQDAGAAAEAPAQTRNKSDLAETRELAVAAMEAALDKRGLEPVLIDVSAMGSYTDFIGVVSGRSDRQVDAIAENVCRP